MNTTSTKTTRKKAVTTPTFIFATTFVIVVALTGSYFAYKQFAPQAPQGTPTPTVQPTPDTRVLSYTSTAAKVSLTFPQPLYVEENRDAGNQYILVSTQKDFATALQISYDPKNTGDLYGGACESGWKTLKIGQVSFDSCEVLSNHSFSTGDMTSNKVNKEGYALSIGPDHYDENNQYITMTDSDYQLYKRILTNGIIFTK